MSGRRGYSKLRANKKLTKNHNGIYKAKDLENGRNNLEDGKDSPLSSLSLERLEMTCLDQHADNLLNGLEVMWRQRSLCDVILVAGTHRLRAHRAVLATCCDYFLGLFTSGSGESQVGDMIEVDMEGMPPSTLGQILEAIYTGRVSISEANVRDLLAAAARLRFFAVEQACGNFLKNRLNKSNCLRMMTMAFTYGLGELLENSLKMAAQYYPDVAQGFDFLQLEEDHLLALIRRDDIQTETELQVFRSAVSWLEYDKCARLKYAAELMGEVRLGLLSPGELVDHVEAVEYLMEIPQCQNLVKEALHYHCLPARQSILQTNRTNPRSATKMECVLAIGGAPRLKNDPVNADVTYFDPKTNMWGLLTKLKEPRHHHAVAVLGGFLYVAGGEETNDQRSPLNSAYRFDPRTNTWLQIASMRHRRESFQLGVLNNLLYAVGGRVDADISLAEVECYNPGEDRWHQVAPLSTPRRSVALAAHNGRLYAMGGSGQKRLSTKVERYNPLTNTWEVRRSLSIPRFFALLTSVASKLYLFGGATLESTGNVICAKKVESYIPLTDTWFTVCPMIQPRAEAGAAVLGNQIYAVGGYCWDTNQRLKSVEVYDIDKDKWCEVQDIAKPYTGIGCGSLTVYHVLDPEEIKEPEEEIPPQETHIYRPDTEVPPSSVPSEPLHPPCKAPSI